MPKAKGKQRPARAVADPGAVELLSRAAFARLMGVDRKAVEKAINNGRLERSVTYGKAGRVRIEPVEGRREWEENRDESKVREPREGNPKAKAKLLIVDQKRRLTQAQADKAEFEAKKLAGQLVEVTAVKRAQFEGARIIRDNVLNVPGRVAAEFAAETDAGRIHARLDAELRQALGAAAEALRHG